MDHCQKIVKATVLHHAFRTGKENKSTHIDHLNDLETHNSLLKLAKWKEIWVLIANIVNALDFTVFQRGSIPDSIQGETQTL